jgi:pimeloyl-ACP methyl ester carboxylesterase
MTHAATSPLFAQLSWIERLSFRALNFLGFASDFKEVAGVTLHSVRNMQRPELPTVVLIHGIGANVTHWTEVLFHLRRAGYSTLALDLPAHGLSSEAPSSLTPQKLSEILHHFLLEEVPGARVLVGNSLGGGLVLREVESAAQGILAYVALSPAGGFTSEEHWGDLQKTLEISERHSALHFLNRVFHRLPFFAGFFVRPLIAAMNRRGVRELIQNTRYADFHSVRIPPLTPPGLIIWGKSDRVFPLQNLDWFKAHLPSQYTRFLSPEKTGHCPQVERGHWTARQILKHLASLK